MFRAVPYYPPRDYASGQTAQASSQLNPRITGRYIKVKFTPEEDARLLELVHEYGTKEWITIASLMRTRNPRQCRERWHNYLNPTLKMGNWTPEEDELLVKKYAVYGSKWSRIARFFKKRSDLSLRNRWQLLERKRKQAAEPTASAPEPQIKAADSEAGTASAALQDPFEAMIPDADIQWLAEEEKRAEMFSWG